jgi:flagellar biosynthesis anti-sigma factor FlgM
MKIDPRAISAYTRTQVRGVEGPNAARPVKIEPEAPRASDPAEVTISAEGKRLAGGASSEKVAALREKIASGSFKVDAQTVAKRLLDTVG